MKKFFITIILAVAVVSGIHGMNVAYRNTRALGYGSYDPPFAITENEQGQTVFRIYDYLIDPSGLLPW